MDLHEKFVKYGLEAKQWMRKCVLLLPEIDRQKIWARHNFGSIYEYAAKLAGMSHKTVNDALNIMEKTEDKPHLRRVIEEKGMWAVKPVIAIATAETDKYWADRANEMPNNTLATLVRESRRVYTPDQKTVLSLDLSPRLANKLEKLKGSNWDETIEDYIKLRNNDLNAQKPPSIITSSRHIPKHIEKFLLKRSNRTCEFPLCKKTYQQLHHADRYAMNRIHDPDRIFALCKDHHNLAHQSLIENENLPVDNWKARKTADKTSPKYHIDQKVRHHQRH